MTSWILHVDLPGQSSHTTLHASTPHPCWGTLPNTLCKINHTFNAVNRLRDENGERVVMFLCTGCRRINKYRARLPRYLCARWPRAQSLHVVTFKFRLHTDNKTRRHIPDKHMGTWSIKQISPSRVLAGMSRKTHLISLSAWVRPLCKRLPANLIIGFKYAVLLINK